MAPGIGTASLILITGFVGSRALGVVRNMVLAGVFGAGPELDAYFAAFRLPDTIFQLIVGAALGSAFIPTFTGVFTRISPEAGWRLASRALIFFTLLGAVIAAAGFVLAPWLVPLTVIGFPPEQQELTVQLSRVMLLSTVFFCASAMVSGILNARFHFLLPALAPWFYNLSIIAGAMGAAGGPGVLGPSIGVSVGAALHLLVQAPGLARVGMRLYFGLDPRVQGMSEVFRLMGPRVLGLTTIQINWLVATVLASTLSSGAITALNYAWAVTMLPLSVLGMAPATAAFPTLAEAAAREDWATYRRTLSMGLRTALFLAIPASVGLALLREPIIGLLFQHGEFGAESTRLTAQALLFYVVGLLAHVVLEMVARGFYALHDTRTPFAFGVAGMAAHAALSLALIQPMGVGALGLAMSLSAMMEAALLSVMLSRKTGALDWGEAGRTVLRTAAASTAMGWVLFGLLAVAPPAQDALSRLLLVSAGIALGGVVFAGSALVLRSPEALMLRDRLTARLAHASRRPEPHETPGAAESPQPPQQAAHREPLGPP